MTPIEIILYFLLFAVFGVAIEVLFTAILEYGKSRNPRMIGKSTLWMFPICGAVFFIVLLVQAYAGDYPWFFRGFLYMVLITAWEYVSGFTIRKMVGVAPWEYSAETPDGIGSKKKYQIDGLICLEYLPLWFVEGLFAETAFLFLKGHFFL